MVAVLTGNANSDSELLVVVEIEIIRVLTTIGHKGDA